MGFILAAAWALCVVVFLPESYESWETPKAAVLRIAGAGLLAAVLATPGWSRRLGRQRLDLAVALWLIVEALATLASRSPRLSVFGDAMQHEGLLTSIALGGIYLASRCCLTSEQAANRALNAWLAGAGVAALYAFAQAAGLDPLPWLRPATIGAVIRPFGTLGHANVLGATTAAAATLALALALRGGRGQPAYAALTAILCAATVLTFSRAAWIALGVGATIVLVLGAAGRGGVRVTRGAALIAGGIALGFSVALVLSPFGAAVLARLRDLAAPATGSSLERLGVWQAAIAEWRERPLLGQGPDTFALAYTRLQPPGQWTYEWNHTAWDAHSIVLHHLATRGAVGLLVAAVAALALASAARRAWRAGGAAKLALPGLAGALVAMLVAGATGAVGIAGAFTLVVLSAMVVSLTPVEAAAVVAPSKPEPRRRRGHKRPTAGPPWRSALPWIAGAAVALPMLLFSGLDVAGLMAAGEARAWSARDESAADPRAREQYDSVAQICRAAARQVVWDDSAPRELSQVLQRWAAGDPRPGLLAEAEATAREATRRVPLRVTNRSQLASVLADAARRDPARVPECEAEFRRAAALAPYDAQLLASWARARVALGHAREALEPARRAVALYPASGFALRALAETELAAGDSVAARGILTRSLSSNWYSEPRARADAQARLTALGRAQ